MILKGQKAKVISCKRGETKSPVQAKPKGIVKGSFCTEPVRKVSTAKVVDGTTIDAAKNYQKVQKIVVDSVKSYKKATRISGIQKISVATCPKQNAQVQQRKVPQANQQITLDSLFQ